MTMFLAAVSADLIPNGAMFQPGGQITLTANTPFPTADVASATSVYYVACNGGYAPIFNGTIFAAAKINPGLALVLDANSAHAGYHQAGKIYDVWGFNDGLCNVKLGTGPSWISDIDRGSGMGTTEFEYFGGLKVNKNDISLRFGPNAGDTITVLARQAVLLGGFVATANGVATDTSRKRLVANAYNAPTKLLSAFGTAVNYTYSSTSWRMVNGDNTLQAEFLLGFSGIPVQFDASAYVLNSTATIRSAKIAIGIDTTTAASLDCQICIIQVAQPLQYLRTSYSGFPRIGHHYAAQIEQGGGSDTQTWFQLDPGNYKAGMQGSFVG